ncbi:MAG: hypothetical protein QM576_24590 [Rhodopseudomonas sp.]|uniref:hypothetical protein n=1 Tax=Rhodopseudomonas sp. TaxID=1078 RepID=UPI0039E339F8
MPNLRVHDAVNGGRAAIASIRDPRIIELANQHSTFRSFIARFKDAFGVAVEPSILIVKKSKSKPLKLEPLASFRDLVALSVIPYQRAQMIVRRGQIPRILYSNTFYLYPWMLDKNYQHLMTSTISGMGLHMASKFYGQSSPDIFAHDLQQHDIDETLFKVLLQRWEHRYFKPKPSHTDIALFRSLNMATVACQTPGVVDTTMYDIGRIVALWVSAFEILAHPGPGQKVDITTIYELFDNISYQDTTLSKKIYKARTPRLRKHTKGNLPQFVYGQLYEARNAFLHGNEVSHATLRPKNSKSLLFHLAPPLYRLALTSVLQINRPPPMPPASDAKAFAKYIVDNMDYYEGQQIVERAILRARRSRN